jgi:hypothetical protein
MAYGKALSTYKRINKIRRSAEKVNQAQSIVNQKRLESIDNARKLQRRREVVGSVAGAVQTAAAYGMSKSDTIRPEDAEKLSAALGGVAEVGTSLFTPMNQDDFFGMSNDEYRNFIETQRTDIAGGAIKGYSLQQSLNELRRRKDLDLSIEGMSDEERMGFTKDELYSVASEVDFETGVGYGNFGRLPEIAKKLETDSMIRRNLIDPEQTPVDEYENVYSDLARKFVRSTMPSRTEIKKKPFNYL